MGDYLDERGKCGSETSEGLLTNRRRRVCKPCDREKDVDYWTGNTVTSELTKSEEGELPMGKTRVGTSRSSSANREYGAWRPREALKHGDAHQEKR